ncbi:M14 family metallopeptidase [Crocinitomix algicola]|uniref:M14 family metallopeptidase n=1 Tax=Crocinitomix algicola TaxID=1740263 RepID=UPI0008723E12|nr:M14-type cytosolic carboxypeptidase [Crocinitomix algicola]
MKISSNFDSGNIEVVSIEENGIINLRIPKDTNSDFFQWFHFRLTEAIDIACTINILNAGESTYPEGWDNYHACVSYDRVDWFRVPTTYENGVLTIEYMPSNNSVYFAYFAPYSYESHLQLVHNAQLSDLCQTEVIGETVEGRDIDMLIIGDEGVGDNVWIIGRQHPGESMAEWFIHGVIDRLLDESDSIAQKLLERCCFYIIPNMNIDGSIAGNLRANAAGANLNREWQSPSMERSPEVFNCLKRMEEVGVDLLLDIHGDEAIPYNFVAASEGIPSYNLSLKNLEEKFKNHWMDICPDFQDEHNYGPDQPGQANLTVCSNAIAEKFGCLSFTIEMPFKDNDDLPDPLYGWSAERSILLGESVLNPIYHVLDDLDF